MNKQDLNKYIPIIIIGLLVFLSFLIIKSFLLPLLSAFILAYLIKPFYDRFRRGLPKPAAAALSIILILIIIFLPLAAIVGGVVNQTYISLDSANLKESLNKLSQSNLLQSLNIDVNELVSKGLGFLINLLTNITSHIPGILITILITVFGIYYILIDWDKLTEKLIKYIPTRNKAKFSKEIAQITNNLVYGTLLIALIEFIVAVFGFYISGVKFYLLLPTLIAIFAFIPGLGPTIVWVPTAIILFIQGNIFSAIGVVITGLILSLFIDMILRAKIAGKGTKTHPLIILIGILGGISVFGIFGFIIGPLILSYAIEIIEEISQSS